MSKKCVLICFKVTDKSDPPIGYIKRTISKCDFCDHEIWVNEIRKNMRERSNTIKLSCSPCAIKLNQNTEYSVVTIPL